MTPRHEEREKRRSEQYFAYWEGKTKYNPYEPSPLRRFCAQQIGVFGFLASWFLLWLANIISYSMSPAVIVQAVIVLLILLFMIGAIVDRHARGRQ